ncbi:MAG: class I SAM-dependent methyltransferase [Clostridium sp.]
MELSLRLKKIADLVESCEGVMDVGTDHGYIPIYLIKNQVCNRAIASDINKGPIQRAKNNIRIKRLNNKIDCRLGGGLSTIKKGEVDVAIIAGMGGNLIRDILEADLDIFKSLDYVIVQPVQNAEVFREYVLSSGYDIIKEEMCIEEGKFYQILKIKYNKNKKISLENKLFYEISETLVKERHPIAMEYARYLISKYERIYNSLNDDTENSKSRKAELGEKIYSLKEVI